MRSLLLVRADRENETEAALTCPADGLVFDFAEMLAGSDIATARARACAWLARARQHPDAPAIYVLLDHLSGPHTEASLDLIMAGRPDGIVLARVRNGADIAHLAVKLSVREAEQGIADGATKIIAIAGATPASLFEMGSLAQASARLAGLIFGGDALARQLNREANASPGGTQSLPFTLGRGLTLLAAKAAQVMAIDAASSSDIDDESLRRACEDAKRDGFSGKLAVDQGQVAIINAVFAER